MRLKTYIFSGLVCVGSGRLEALFDHEADSSGHFVFGNILPVHGIDFEPFGLHGFYNITIPSCISFGSALAQLKYALDVLQYDAYLNETYTCITHGNTDSKSIRKIKNLSRF